MLINEFEKAKEWLEQADAILITASNGLSIAEGYHIFANNEPFREYFSAFAEKYGVDCLIRGVFTPMTKEDHAAYMRTVHQYMIDDYRGSSVMRDLYGIVCKKPYFIVTSNCDTHFQMNGFDKSYIFEVEGNFDGMQEGSAQWQEQRQRFADFIQEHETKKVVLLELGIGSRNRLIKAPTMDMAVRHTNWNYITMNMPREINVPAALQEKTIALTGDIGTNFGRL